MGKIWTGRWWFKNIYSWFSPTDSYGGCSTEISQGVGQSKNSHWGSDVDHSKHLRQHPDHCDLYDELIESVLGPHQTNSSHSSSTSQSRVSIDDIDEACAKIQLELTCTKDDCQTSPAISSKDRSRLFMVDRIMLSMMTTIWLQISFGQFIHPKLCSILPKSFYFPTFCIYIAEYDKKTIHLDDQDSCRHHEHSLQM